MQNVGLFDAQSMVFQQLLCFQLKKLSEYSTALNFEKLGTES